MCLAENKLYLWLLKRITKKIIIQGFDHKKNVILFYSILIAAAKNEFTEDNRATLNSFLNECHEEALKLNP